MIRPWPTPALNLHHLNLTQVLWFKINFRWMLIPCLDLFRVLLREFPLLPHLPIKELMIMTVWIVQTLQLPLCLCKASKPTFSSLFYLCLSRLKEKKDRRTSNWLKTMSSLVSLTPLERVSQCIMSIRKIRITSS